MPILIKLFNLILIGGNYPTIWGEGIISTIFKNGSKLDPGNYHGITVSSCLGKLFNMVLNNRLRNLCDKKSIINDSHFGF